MSRVKDQFEGVSPLSEARALERRHASGALPFIKQDLRPDLNVKHDRVGATGNIERLYKMMSGALPNSKTIESKSPTTEHPLPPKQSDKIKESLNDDKILTDFKVYVLDAGGKGLAELKNDNDTTKLLLDSTAHNGGVDIDPFGDGPLELGGGDSKGQLGTGGPDEPGDANPEAITVTETYPDARFRYPTRIDRLIGRRLGALAPKIPPRPSRNLK
jgi:hypothetical protein